jgi:hypothetical protein
MNRLLYVLRAVVIIVFLVSWQNSTLEVNDTEIKFKADGSNAGI